MSPDKSPATNLSIDELLEQFSSSSSRKQRTLSVDIEDRSGELIQIQSAGLDSFDPEGDDWKAGWILQVINRHQPQFLEKIYSVESSGWFKSSSASGINYEPLQRSLLEEKYEEADRFTTASLRKLAGPAAEDRGYVYFSEVDQIPSEDLISLDRLWVAFSKGKFGFSVQARLLNSLSGRYEMLWPKIGWKNDGVWTRYPNSFNWTINAPEGHMPLINQLRGVRLMNALMTNPAIKSRQ